MNRNESPELVEIDLGEAEISVIKKIVAVLPMLEGLVVFQNALHRVVGNKEAMRLDAVPPGRLRAMLSDRVCFVRNGKNAECPAGILQNVVDEKLWPRLEVVTDRIVSPRITSTGRHLKKRGVAKGTGNVYVGARRSLTIPDNLTQTDARRAAQELKRAFAAFPLKHLPLDVPAIVAAIISILARAFLDKLPGLLLTANKPRAGKTTIAKLIHEIATGASASITAPPTANAELYKLIVSKGRASASTLILDNLSGAFSATQLEAAMTSEILEARVMHTHDVMDVRFRTLVMLTSNDVQLRRDQENRLMQCRLHVKSSTGSDDAAANAEQEIRRNKDALCEAALTILCAYLQAGRPAVEHEPLRGYAQWSELVQSAVVWAGLKDPLLRARKTWAASAAAAELPARVVLTALLEHSGDKGMLASDLISVANGDSGLANALKSLASTSQEPTSKQVGKSLARLLGKHVDVNETTMVLKRQGRRSGGHRWTTTTR